MGHLTRLCFLPQKSLLSCTLNSPLTPPLKDCSTGQRRDKCPDLDHGRGRIVKPTASAKLLGVYLDSQLRFADHLVQIDKKCTKSLQAISALGRSKWGLRLADKRLIYNACIVPRALYASSVWMSPDTHGAKAIRKRQLRILTAIQRRAAHGISGAFRKVSGDTLNAQLHLRPMSVRIEENRLKTLTRRSTSPAYRAIKLQRSHYRRPLLRTALETTEEDLELQAEYDIEDFEVRQPFVVPPWWEPPDIDIAASRPEAATVHWAHNLLTPTVPKIYPEGRRAQGWSARQHTASFPLA